LEPKPKQTKVDSFFISSPPTHDECERAKQVAEPTLETNTKRPGMVKGQLATPPNGETRGLNNISANKIPPQIKLDTPPPEAPNLLSCCCLAAELALRTM